MPTPQNIQLRPSPIDNRDHVAETIYSTEVVIPSTLDYRAEMRPVRHQGETQTCAAQTAAAMKEWQESRDVKLYSYMSPQFIYDNREDTNNEGMYSRDVLRILNKVGIVPETMYPFGNKKEKSQISSFVWQEAVKFCIAGYAQVLTMSALKTALVKNGPCYIAVPMYNGTTTMWRQQAGEALTGGHAMTVVGYDKTGFILRNTWGADWGDGGYCIFPFSDWGMQWEIWTTIDADSPAPDPAYNTATQQVARSVDKNKSIYIIGGVIALLAVIAIAVSGSM
ncbi:MAG: C1 family peptidase [Mariprofundales bacterium]